MKRILTIGFVVTLGLSVTAGIMASGSAQAQTDDAEHGAHVTRLLMPSMNSGRGMKLFIGKGCFACHAVNGVGGHDSASLDAHDMEPYMNPFDLAAKMWRMAPYMIAAQEEALGEQIQFTGDELSDIIAFLHDDEQQHEFTEDMLTAENTELMNHEHGAMTGVEAHEEEIGHEEGAEHGHDE